MLTCLAELLSFISSSIWPNDHQKGMAKSRRVWYLLLTPHWLGRVKAKKRTTQAWVNFLTGVGMTLMEWYPFLVYYKITQILFVTWFIFYSRSSFSSLSHDLQAFLEFPWHPTWGYYTRKPIKSGFELSIVNLLLQYCKINNKCTKISKRDLFL